MFPLSNGRLIRINKDGTNGEITQSKKSTLIFGSSPIYDHHVIDLDPSKDICCEISTDEYGRVSAFNHTDISFP